MAIPVGSQAPDFTLKSKQTSGLVDVKLSNNFGKKNTVLLFFPAAFTSVCTKEMCDISAGLNGYSSLNADVIGINPQPSRPHGLRDFVQACIGLGMPDARIIFRHILPNCLAPIIVLASLMVATAILIESGLSFLGLSDPNVMSWGFQVGAGRGVLRVAWWLCAIPGVAILLTVLAINLVGEGLNDALNPRLRR